MIRASVLRVVSVVAVATLLPGCASERRDDIGGPGLPQQRDGETYPGPRRPMTGHLVVADDGCFLLRQADRRRFVVWPGLAAHGGAEVILGDGTRATDGDRLAGEGTVMPVEQLAQWPDGYWGTTVGFCDPKATEVVVFDSVAVDQP